jgi:hypothetical protein
MAEVTNCVITVLGRSFLIGSGLPRFLWTEAFHHAVWIKFHSPHSALPGTTPYEFVHKKKPNLQNLHKFGVTVYVKDLTAGKLDIQVKIGRFVGYDDESKGYRIYWPEKRSVTIEREVRFNPDEILIPDDLLGNEGEWPTFGDSNITNPATNPPEPSAEPSSSSNAPHNDASRPREIPEESIPPPHLPDNLDPPEPNTGRGYRTRPMPGHYTRMQQGNIAKTANVMADYPDEDDHELFCAAAMFPEHDDKLSLSLRQHQVMNHCGTKQLADPIVTNGWKHEMWKSRCSISYTLSM